MLSFAKLSKVDPGFAASNVLLVSMETVAAHGTRHSSARRCSKCSSGCVSVPGVEAVSSAEYNVLGRSWTTNPRLPGRARETIETTMAPVTPGFFETMRIPLLAGRAFAPGDMGVDNAAAIVVNETFARRYFAGAPAVGRLVEGRMGNQSTSQYQVLGVVADTKYDLRKAPAPIIYMLLRPTAIGTLHVRVSGDAVMLAARLREEIRAANPLFRVTSVTSQSAAVAQTLLRERLMALLAGFFAVVGLVLAAVGLYGVLSYSVVQRTREIGIRVALGARQLGVVRTVLAEAGGTALVGAGFGLAGGLYLSRFVESLLFEVTPLELWSVVLPLGTLLLAALFAAAFPALRAARVDPVIALRYE